MLSSNEALKELTRLSINNKIEHWFNTAKDYTYIFLANLQCPPFLFQYD